jgi:tetratricopeptide (TPR) repeat protein
MNCTTVSRTLCISLLFFLVGSFHAFAIEQQPTAQQQYLDLVAKGKESFDKENYPAALEYFTKAEVLVEKNQWKEKRFFINNNIGIVYEYLSNYGEALGYYQKALDIAKTSGQEASIASVLNNIGAVYARENDYETAIDYYKKSYRIAKAKNYAKIRATLAQNISDIYNIQGNFKEARKYLLEVENVPSSKKQKQLLKINYAESFIVEGRISEAQKMIEKLMKEVDQAKENGCYICVVELLSEIYEKQNKLDEAILYAKKGLHNSTNLNDRITFYDKLSTIYSKKADYSSAVKYKDSVIINKDSLAAVINRELFETNKAKLKVQEYQNEMKSDKEKYEAERKLFIIGIVFCLVLFFFIYKAQKNRILKQKQEKTIAENQQKIFTLELDSLKNNIAEKNRKLSAKALYLSGRNEIIEEIINSLGQIPDVFQNKEVINYIKTLKDYLKTDAEWDDFITYFEQVNHDFFRALKTRHPDLTPHDIRFLCYIYMNLDIKEISNIFSITSEAGRKRKQRIAKKMGIDIDDLHEYILKIH